MKGTSLFSAFMHRMTLVRFCLPWLISTPGLFAFWFSLAYSGGPDFLRQVSKFSCSKADGFGSEPEF